MSPTWRKKSVLVLSLATLATCGRLVEEEPHPESTATAPAPVQATDDFQREQEALLAEARGYAAQHPDDPHALIWVGRRLGYLGRYEEAIELYTVAIGHWPELPHLYRHRGHRYISVRQFERAEADLSRAAELIHDQEDEVEPDGLPNDRGIPTSTLQSNIWYHLGLARYLQGDFEGAAQAYWAGLEVSQNPDMLCATSHWQYMTLRRLGLQSQALELLGPIDAEMDIIENHDYHRLLLMYKGTATPEEVWKEVGAGSKLGLATLGYGIGNWHLYEGDPAMARDVFTEIVDQGPQAAFGYLAAEADLERLNQ